MPGLRLSVLDKCQRQDPPAPTVPGEPHARDSGRTPRHRAEYMAAWPSCSLADSISGTATAPGGHPAGPAPATKHLRSRLIKGKAVSNAQRHGRPPATVRIWVTPGRIVVTVHDKGRGPADRLAGPSPRAKQHHGPATWTWALGHAPTRHRHRAQARRRRLHRQAPQRNDTWLSRVALATISATQTASGK